MVSLQKFIQDLNGDLAREYAAAIQYYQHAATLTGLHAAFTGELLAHAGEEIGHAKTLNEHIDYLKGIPLTNVAPIFSASSPESKLQQDLAAEEEAILRYTERIKQAEELVMPASIQILKAILVDEIHHATDLRNILNV